ncbi:MAG: cyclase family protein, partial [Proteobacteria bacterium]|nr:cyclase family protein [Pseudomonadota bacterium]
MNIIDSNIIDLTHALSADIPSWDGSCGFDLATVCDYKDCSGPDLFRIQKITSRAGMGTHIDAPAHCFPGSKTIDTLELKNLITDCVVIKVHDVADENYLLMPETILKFEKEHGVIKENTFVICHTGWDRYWTNPEKYRNNLRFPSIHESTGKLLLERNIAGLGIDTLSPDAQGKSFPIHRTILGAGKYLVENVTNANNLPAIGAKIIAAPMKIKDGTEA